MHITTLSNELPEAQRQERREHGAPPEVCRFGMIMFLVSEAMLFAGLIIGYLVLRMAKPGDWPPLDVPSIQVQWPLTTLNIVMIINTFLLISSSMTYHFAEASIKKKGRSGLLWLFLTIILGATFVSVQAYEWIHLKHEGLWFNTGGVYGSAFFVLTGFHGMHVLIGLLLIVWCFLRQLFTRYYNAERHTSLDNVGLYWHFVDVVWIGLYTLLYVI